MSCRGYDVTLAGPPDLDPDWSRVPPGSKENLRAHVARRS